MNGTREYQETHPWINFKPDLRDSMYPFWIQVGQAQAKCEQLAGVPLLPSVAKKLHQVYLAKGALATTALEGNTLTEEDAQNLILGDLNLPPSKGYLAQALQNIVDACDSMATQIVTSQKPLKLTVEGIKKLNYVVLNDLPLSDDISPGEIREDKVIVGRYRGVAPQDCEYLLGRLCSWLNDNTFLTDESFGIGDGIIKAILAHLYVAWIHPFGDGNGRTARLVEFQILLSSGLPTAAAHLLSNHYNLTRDEYYFLLDRSSKSGGDVVPFVQYALQGLIDGLNEQIEYVEEQQMGVHWINHIHSEFHDKDSPANVRRRRLIIDLSDQPDPVAILDIRHISPRIKEIYEDRTDRTIRNDIYKLVKMNLLEQVGNGVRCKKEDMLSFRSPSLT
ncbi:MAG: Fic family protein [Caldilineaceae bacterium SB0662_bin_25]|nr:Fic family protein [Caldilineaceae bacterium SB0662_bin_25]